MQMKVLMVQCGNVFQKNTFVTSPNLEFDLYDGVAHCNIRMKASVLIYEKLKGELQSNYTFFISP